MAQYISILYLYYFLYFVSFKIFTCNEKTFISWNRCDSHAGKLQQ